MRQDAFIAALSDEGARVLDLVKTDRGLAAELMRALSDEERIGLVSREAAKDPKTAQELLFLLADDEGRDVVEGLSDRTVFRILKSQSSTHIGMLSLLGTKRIQSILDLDQELFSTKGVTDPEAAYHWMVSFLEEDEATFAALLENLDPKVVAAAFQDGIVRPNKAPQDEAPEDKEEGVAFPADFFTKLDRMELKPDDLDFSDEETLDILNKIYLVNEPYFHEVISLMLRQDNLKQRAAEEAFDRIHEQVGDMSRFAEEAEDMFVPLDE
jgi:hypothetical protein